MGQVLACGAIIKSNLYARGSNEEQEKVIEMLINAGNKRMYLSLAAVTFLIELIETVSCSIFDVNYLINNFFL